MKIVSEKTCVQSGFEFFRNVIYKENLEEASESGNSFSNAASI